MNNINEKLIQTPPKTPNEGQVIVMAGAAGSGKNFVIDNFTDISNKFKLLDIDEIQHLIIRSKIIFKRFREYLVNTSSPYRNYSDQDLKDPSMFKDSEFTDTLYNFMIENKIPQTKLGVFLKVNKNRDHLPNIVLNTTFGNTQSIENKLDVIMDAGYKPENVHLIWVVTTMDESLSRNLARERTVAAQFVKQNYRNVVDNIRGLLGKDQGVFKDYIGGNVWAVVNLKEMTQYYKDKKTIKDFNYLLLRDKKGWYFDAIKTLLTWFDKNDRPDDTKEA